MKKIRSELKVPIDTSSAAGSSVKVTSPAPSVSSTSSVPASSPPSHEGAPPGPRGPRGSDDDIYEFREPEPFEFEVRARRESPFNEDRVHHQHQRFPPQQSGRKSTKEEEEETSPKKAATPTSSVIFSTYKNLKHDLPI